MYTYIFDGVGFKINTPAVQKAEVLSQAADRNVMRYTYSDGLVLEVEQTVKQAVVYSNRPLVQEPDSSYSPGGK